MRSTQIDSLAFEDAGERDSKIIAVPIEEHLRTIKATSYRRFKEEYVTAKLIVELWFLNYKERSIVEFNSWQDKETAKTEIEKWQISK
ncbi:inorganic diphosphatase [Porticoccaceae bacterium]|nr:inorganic diphosphatase [Porticoccaceae bacterium]